MEPKPTVEHFWHPIDERLGLSYITRNNNRLPYYRKLTLHEIKVFEINAT